MVKESSLRVNEDGVITGWEGMWGTIAEELNQSAAEKDKIQNKMLEDRKNKLA